MKRRSVLSSVLGLIIASLILSSCTVPEWIPTNLLTGSDEMRNGSDFIKRVNVGYKFGYINKDGKVVIPAKYDEVFPFKNGRARVRVGERIGYIDRDGNYIQKPECSRYDRSFEDFYLCSQGREYFVRNWKGKNIVPEPLNWISEGSRGFSALRGGSQRFTYFDLQGNEVFQADEIGNWQQGIAPFKDKGKWGYIRDDGTILLAARYDRADPFQSGQGYVSLECKYYRVSPSGELTNAPPRPREDIQICGPRGNAQVCHGKIENEQSVKCEKLPEEGGNSFKCAVDGASFTVNNVKWVSAYQYGLAHARQAGTEKLGMVNLKGEWVLKPRFNRIGYFDGCYAYSEIDHIPFAIDRSGTLHPIKENAEANVQGSRPGEGVRCFELLESGRRYKCITKDYRPHPQLYEDIDEYSEGLMAVTLDYGRSGFVDRNGTLVIPARYDFSDRFAHDRAPVRIDMGEGVNNLYGYINRKGEMVIAAQYQDARPFHEGLARVSGSPFRKYFFIGFDGEVVIEGPFAEAQDFSEGLAGVAIGTQWGFLDKEGNLMFGRKYDYGYYISEGKVSFCDRGLCGYLNEKGEVIIPARFCETEEFSEGLAAVAERCIEDEDGYVVGIWGYIDSSGEYVLPPSEDYTGKPILDGYTIVKKKGLYRIMDRTGQISTGYRFRAIRAMFGEDTGGPVIYRIELDGKFGFIRGDGSMLTGKTYKQVLGFDEGRAFVLNEDFTWSMINAYGEVMAKTEYTVIGGYQSLFECGLILVGYVKPSKREELANKLTQAGIKEQFGILRRSSVIYGYMDRDGELVIPLDFAYANPFQSYSDAGCYASVRKLSGARYIKIDVDGNEFPDF